MHETLLRTKLNVPPLRPNLVPRPQLIERLNQGLQPGRKLTLISAPAGYGKTTSLIEWVHSTRSPIGWLSLDRADNDFECFFRYLVTAWEEVQPGVMESPLGILVGTMSPDNEAVLAAFINLASELANHTGFILDDYQLIEEPAIHQALTILLDHLPAKAHFVLAGRGEPPLALARYRARDELQEIGADDPVTAVSDPYCRSCDLGNQYVVDSAFFPSSSVSNPALAIAAQALGVAYHRI